MRPQVAIRVTKGTNSWPRSLSLRNFGDEDYTSCYQYAFHNVDGPLDMGATTLCRSEGFFTKSMYLELKVKEEL